MHYLDDDGDVFEKTTTQLIDKKDLFNKCELTRMRTLLK